jgi:hypothetical protein
MVLEYGLSGAWKAGYGMPAATRQIPLRRVAETEALRFFGLSTICFG